MEKLRQENIDQHSTDFNKHMGMMGKIKKQIYETTTDLCCGLQYAEYRRGQANGFYNNRKHQFMLMQFKKLNEMTKAELQDYLENKYVNNMKNVSPESEQEESNQK